MKITTENSLPSKRQVFLVQEEDARFVSAKAGDVDIALTSATIATNEIDGMHVEEVESVDNRGITFPPCRMRERQPRTATRSETTSLQMMNVKKACVTALTGRGSWKRL